jgi:hypothetical protein
VRIAKQADKTDPKNRAVNRAEFRINFLLKTLRTGKATGQYTRYHSKSNNNRIKKTNNRRLPQVSSTTFENNCTLQAENIDFCISQPTAMEFLFESQQELVLKLPLPRYRFPWPVR